jgi:dihydrolipoamide dehydrogenase
MEKKKYDVVIIGAGTAGLTARKIVANSTQNYVVIDDGILGTTCARVGCMPSKVLIQVANDFNRRHSLSEEGIDGGEKLVIDHKRVMKHVRKLRDRFVRGVIGGMESWQETHLVRKRAKFLDQNTLSLGDEEIQADKIIIATGSRPSFPPIWNDFEKYTFNTDSFFELEELPKRVAVVGLGVIGIEIGQALHRLGIEVVGIARRKSIGGVTDPELLDYVADSFSKEMNLDWTGVQSLAEVEGALEISTGDKKYLVDKVLLSAGRRPNNDRLGLEEINIKLDDRGMPDFDPNTYQIKDTSLYIAGDVNGERPLLHESADEGSIAGYNAVAAEPRGFKRRTFIGVAFSSPNIAAVGMTYKELEKKSIDFAIGQVSFEGQGRSIVMLAEKGLLRVYGCKETNRILGAELFGPSGEHIAHLLAWVISQGMTVQQVLSLPFYHPTVEEGLRTALRDLSTKLGEEVPPLEVNFCD